MYFPFELQSVKALLHHQIGHTYSLLVGVATHTLFWSRAQQVNCPFLPTNFAYVTRKYCGLGKVYSKLSDYHTFCWHTRSDKLIFSSSRSLGEKEQMLVTNSIMMLAPPYWWMVVVVPCQSWNIFFKSLSLSGTLYQAIHLLCSRPKKSMCGHTYQ